MPENAGKETFHQVYYTIDLIFIFVENSVVDPKLFVTDPDPTFQIVTDPVSDPNLKSKILRSFLNIPNF
jgi:hypothetical protein